MQKCFKTVREVLACVAKLVGFFSLNQRKPDLHILSLTYSFYRVEPQLGLATALQALAIKAKEPFFSL